MGTTFTAAIREFIQNPMQQQADGSDHCKVYRKVSTRVIARRVRADRQANSSVSCAKTQTSGPRRRLHSHYHNPTPRAASTPSTSHLPSLVRRPPLVVQKQYSEAAYRKQMDITTMKTCSRRFPE